MKMKHIGLVCLIFSLAFFSACGKNPASNLTSTPTSPSALPTMNAMTVTAHAQEILALTSSPNPVDFPLQEGTPAPGTSTEFPLLSQTQSQIPTPDFFSTQPVISLTLTSPVESAPGEVVTLGGLKMSVIGFRDLEATAIQAPQPGMKFVAVELVIVNAGTNTEIVSSLQQMYLRDSSGQFYASDFLASTLLSDPLDGDLLPGERLVGSVAFQIPQNSDSISFIYSLAFPVQMSAVVALGSSPFQVAVPDELTFTLPSTVHSMEETFRIGDYNLTVHNIAALPSNDTYPPLSGYRFVKVEMTIQNVAGASQTVASLLQMDLVDGVGRTFDADYQASFAFNLQSVDGELPAGSSVRGNVIFQVLNASTTFYLVFNPDIFGAGDVEAYVSLGAVP